MKNDKCILDFPLHVFRDGNWIWTNPKLCNDYLEYKTYTLHIANDTRTCKTSIMYRANDNSELNQKQIIKSLKLYNNIEKNKFYIKYK